MYPTPLVSHFNKPFRNFARGLVIARLTMDHGTVLGDANKKQ